MNNPSALHKNRKRHNWLVYHYIDLHLIEAAQSGKINGTLYDLGCGEMPYRYWLLQYAKDYIGVDWSGTLHELQADIVSNLNNELPIKDETADTIVSLSVMEHLYEPQTFLNEAHRILKKDGTIILQVPFMWWVHEAPHDYYRYTYFGLQYMFKKAGFEKINISAQAGFWSMLTLKFNYQTARLVQFCSSWPWPLNKIIAFVMQGLWLVNQRIAPWLDQYWKCEAETLGYFVTAKK